MALPFDIKMGQRSLRRGRQSLSGATYFLTACTARRSRSFENGSVTADLLDHAQHIDGWKLRAAVVMPDHVHLLVDFTASRELSEVVREFKGRTSVMLRRHAMKWQSGYFDHRLRTNEDVLPIFLYIFLNPYRAGLIPYDQRWPGYFCSPDDWVWFEPLTSNSLPFPEWLAPHRGIKPLLQE